MPASEVEPLLEQLRREADSVRRYRAVVHIRGKGPGGRFSATEVVVFERPDRLRMELLGPFGTTRWIAVVREGEITVWFPSRREFLRESRVEDVVGALVGLELGTDEIMAALCGVGVPLGGRHAEKAVRERDEVRIDLDEASLELVEGEVRRASRPGYRVSYPAGWKRRGGQVPDHIDIEGGEIQARLRVEDADVNVDLHPEAFVVELPEDATPIELQHIGSEAVFVKTSR